MIRLESIRKEYDDLIAVKNLNLTINKGDIFGLIGPNGAGKTTTMKIMVGLLEPTQGQVYLNDQPINKDDAAFRKIIGYMPDFFSLYDELKTWEYLDFFARAYKIPNRQNRIDEMLNLTDLTGKRNDLVANLSRGMKQRLAIGKTLLHDPEILVLDEPAAGLDPTARIQLRDIIKKLAAQGKTTFISSHILTELSDICNTIGIMQKAVMVESGKIDDIISRVYAKKVLRLDTLSDKSMAAAFVKTMESVEDAFIKDNFIEILFSGNREQIPILHKKLVGQGIEVVSFYEYRQNLEEIFMSLSVKEVS
ncbi:MAG: ABC transporter ATP-binding protein, partial [Planctomycetota bacterium]